MRRRLAIAAAVLAVVTGACGSRVRSDVWDDLAAQDRSVTATTSRGESIDEGDETDGTTDTTTGTERSTKSTGGDKSSTPATVAGALPAPADGTYTYDESGEGARRTTMEKWTAQRSSDSVMLTSLRTEDDEGETITTSTKFRVTRSVFEMLSDTTTYDGEDPDTCTYKPPVLVLRLPLKTGEKWKSSAACSEDGAEAGESGDELQVEVTGTSNDTIGGKAVKTFLVRSTESFDSTDETSGERTTFTLTDVRHVDPNTLLVVIEDVTFDFGGDKSTLHRQLRSLTPA